MSSFTDNDSDAPPAATPAATSTLSASEQLRRMKIAEAVAAARAQAVNGRVKGDSQELLNTHKFWSTQPVPALTGGGGGDEDANGTSESSDAPATTGGRPLRLQTVEGTRKEPYPLPPGFEWAELNVQKEEELDAVYTLLNKHYVEDDDNMFRFDYSRPFLRWAVCPPGYDPRLHLGVKASKTGKLMGCITAIPQTMCVEGKLVKMVEINFLCVHKKLRSKRLAPVLIKEITRRVNLTGVFSACYTAGVVLPGAVGVARYYHRTINLKKLVDVGFTRVPRGKTLALQQKLYRVPKEPATKGFREMKEEDVEGAWKLVMNYLKAFKVYPALTLEEFRHWLLPKPKVVNSYISTSATGEVENFCSFYHLPSSCVQHPTHSHIYAAYSYYNVATTVSLRQLMKDCLGEAKKDGQDVFNALNVMENDEFLTDLNFGMGDGNLNYYLFNWQTEGKMDANELGLVLL